MSNLRNHLIISTRIIKFYNNFNAISLAIQPHLDDYTIFTVWTLGLTLKDKITIIFAQF